MIMQVAVAGSNFLRIKSRMFLKVPREALSPKYTSLDLPSKSNYFLHEEAE